MVMHFGSSSWSSLVLRMATIWIVITSLTWSFYRPKPGYPVRQSTKYWICWLVWRQLIGNCGVKKVVWSDGFVGRISDVYVNRRQKTPEKPSFYTENPGEADVSTSKSTQSKVKESKGKETKETPNGVMASGEADIQAQLKRIMKHFVKQILARMRGRCIRL